MKRRDNDASPRSFRRESSRASAVRPLTQVSGRKTVLAIADNAAAFHKAFSRVLVLGTS